MGAREARLSKPSADFVREAEASKVRIFATPGNFNITDNLVDKFLTQTRNEQEQNQTQTCHSAVVDENYLVIGTHLDQSLVDKIVNGEYVDFARLLPKDRITREEDHRMEIVNKGGLTYFVPVSDRECGSISNFSRWEQAFRIYSNVYTRRYPYKASELIQYNHIIYTAAQTYVWENVYLYDKEFRHLSNFPQRSWAVILQQAWMMYLKDWVRDDYRGNHQGGETPKGNGNK